jgi:sulfite reductase (ferredoxin)
MLFQLPDVFSKDADRFKEETERFKRGEISAPQFRSFRVPMGVYEQRESDTYMLRVRFPAGGILPHQMRVLADVARKYGNGVLHVTTRQDIQIHRVLLDDIHPAFVELYASGLSSRGGGGNTVRNITACHDAGVCPDEVFDTAPYAIALSEYLLPDPLSYQLPRKCKIAFAGCSKDCSGASVHDVGFFAKRRNGAAGFAVFVGGGLGAQSRVADRLEEFVPAEEAHLVAEAVKRVFDKHGNRKNRAKARIRFLIEKIGLDGFRELYEAEMAELRSANPQVAVRELPVRKRPAPSTGTVPGEGFAEWRRNNVAPQRPDETYSVQLSLRLGDIPSDTLEKLADVVERHGEGSARTTQWQNLILRWVHENELAELHAALRGLGLAQADPPVLRDLVSCAGAATCKLGICRSRGLASAIRAALERGGADLEGLGDLKIHVSGCPNACGRHPVADIGFYGAARRVKGRLVPHYVLQLGGKVSEGEARLARGKRTIPARNLPEVVVEFLDVFRKSAFTDFGEFLEAESQEVVDRLAKKHSEVPDFQEDKNYYYDWDSEEVFSLAGRGPGECGAGVFDLIEVDLASAREALAQDRSFEATVLAARSLLVTQGQEAQNDSEALQLFKRYFLDEKLVDPSFGSLIEEANHAAKRNPPGNAFAADAADVTPFVQTVQSLFDNMDPSLRFKTAREEPTTAPTTTASVKADREADFRGVVCPLNYVKTKMILDKLGSGQVLSVLLDEEGTNNVPESVTKDGHEVLSLDRVGDQWRVLIRRA